MDSASAAVTFGLQANNRSAVLLPTIPVNVSASNHTFDFGLRLPPTPDAEPVDGNANDTGASDTGSEVAGGTGVSASSPTDEQSAGAGQTPTGTETLAFTGPGLLPFQLASGATSVGAGWFLLGWRDRRRHRAVRRADELSDTRAGG